MKVFGRANTPVKYSSVPTRYVSIDGFMGGAQGTEDHSNDMKVLPCEINENLAVRFNSGVFRNDLPSRYGPANVDYHLAGQKLTVGAAIRSWFRNKGEPR